MKKRNKNINAVMAVVAIFIVMSVVAGVVMAVTQTNALPDSTNSQQTTNSEVIQTESEENSISSGNSVVEDNLADGGTDSEEGTVEPTTEPTTEPTAEPTTQPTPTIEPTTAPTVAPTVAPTAKPTQPPVQNVSPDMYSAMWISYLEFQSVDFSSKSAFKSQMTQMFANCRDMGLNTVIVQVRPFGDALYDSDIFPSSHLITGTQGDKLPFDPLGVMVDIAHSMNLRIEAWVNPYRVRLSSKMPSNISADNPANNQELVFNAEGGIYYNPALTEVQDMVVAGIAEIVENYDVDGIHLDDYFYPSTDMTLDEDDYASSGTNLSQADWRRENVNTLVKKIYKKVKSIDSSVTFGISPQGNNDNNYSVQYSDVKLWLSTEGYVDYIMPQLYWGFGYLTKSGRTDYQFVNLSEEWASYPRHSSVKLYIGLGAYRIGDGDGGANDQSEWSSGNNLMKMVNAVNANPKISGFGLYRYDNLFKNSKYSDLARSEVEHLAEVLKG